MNVLATATWPWHRVHLRESVRCRVGGEFLKHAHVIHMYPREKCRCDVCMYAILVYTVLLLISLVSHVYMHGASECIQATKGIKDVFCIIQRIQKKRKFGLYARASKDVQYKVHVHKQRFFLLFPCDSTIVLRGSIKLVPLVYQ